MSLVGREVELYMVDVFRVDRALIHSSGALIFPGRIMCGVRSQVNVTRCNIIQASQGLQRLHGDGTSSQKHVGMAA